MFVARFLALGLAQSASAPLAVPANQWIVDYSRTACTLARRVGGEGSPIVAFNAPYGSEPGELVVLEAGDDLRDRLTGEVQVRAGDTPVITARAWRDQRNGRTISHMASMPEDFLDRIAGARQLTVSKDGQGVVTLSLPNPREAVEALLHCNDDLLQSWGIDVAARRALSRKARMRNYDWAFNLMPRASTYVILAADISEAGRATGCRILVSTRNPRFDSTICDQVQRVARFEPALNAQAQPIAAQYVTQVRWSVESDD
jgi:hypothetical protein